MRLVAPVVAGLALLAAIACGGARESASSANDASARTGVCGDSAPATPDSVGAAPSAADTLGALPDSLRDAFALLAALEDSIARAPQDARAPGWLLRAGRIARTRLSGIQYGTPAAAIARQRADIFGFDEISGAYLYRGVHFDTLRARHPDDSLADDAAFEFFQLVWGGECEGFFTCYLGSAIEPAVRFLAEYPQSPHAVTVTAAVDADVQGLLRAFEAGERFEWDEAHDSAVVDRLTRRYEEVVARLTGEPARTARLTVEALRRRRPRR